MKVPKVPWKNIAAIGGCSQDQRGEDQTHAALLHGLTE